MDYDSNDNLNKSKRILCFNAIKGNACTYGAKCMYAHSLADQKIDPIRHKVYTILKNNNDLSNINLVKDRKLFNTLTQLTKVCYHCYKGECHGGYNCRNGAISPKFKVCNDDLLYGNCRRLKCNGMHLTLRGLIPYYIQMNKIKNNNYNNYTNKTLKTGTVWDNIDKLKKSIKKDEPNINDETEKDKKQKPNRTTVRAKRTLNSSNLDGILLTERFLMKHFNNNIEPDSSESEDSEIISKMKCFLNNEESHDSLEETIFID